MRTTILSVLIFITVLTVPFVPENCHADGQDGELMHDNNAGVHISPSENKSYDWVAIFSPEGLTTVAVLSSFITHHLSGEPFTWQELEAAKATPSLLRVRQFLICGVGLTTGESSPTNNVTRGRQLEFRDGAGVIAFDWMPGDRCEIQVNNYVTPQGTGAHPVSVQYKALVSAIDPRFLRLTWLTVPLPARSEGPSPPADTFVIGQDGQPHPGIRDFPYMTTVLDELLWGSRFLLSSLFSPTTIVPVIGALLALLGCVNWHGYCDGLGMGRKRYLHSNR